LCGSCSRHCIPVTTYETSTGKATDRLEKHHGIELKKSSCWQLFALKKIEALALMHASKLWEELTALQDQAADEEDSLQTLVMKKTCFDKLAAVGHATEVLPVILELGLACQPMWHPRRVSMRLFRKRLPISRQ